MVTAPLFSLVVPVYNRGECAALLVDSLRSQTEQRWEALLVDDGSEPDAREVWQRATAGEERFRWLDRDREPKGAPTCRNTGWEAARGRYLIFLDCDDALAGPDCLAQRLEAMEEHGDCDFVVSPTEVFHQRPGDLDRWWNVPCPTPDLERFLQRDIPWQTTGPTWRRDALDRIGPWNESLPGRQDWEFHIRALCAGLAYRRIEGGISLWRMTRKGSVSGRLSMEEHLGATEGVLGGIISLMEETGRMNDRCRRLLAMQHVAVAMAWEKAGRKERGAGAVELARVRGVLPDRLAGPLCLYARSSRVPLMSKVVQVLLAPMVHRDYFVPWWTRQLRVRRK